MTLYEYLENNISFEQGEVEVRGHMYSERRLTAAYGDKAGIHCYSGKVMDKYEWDDALQEIRNLMVNDEELQIRYNTALVSHYRDGQDKISYHSYDKVAGVKSVAFVTLGATRYIAIRHRITKEITKIRLNTGTLLIMAENFQENYEYAINVESSIRDGTIMITYMHTE